mgnify:CR=1 FL=1
MNDGDLTDIMKRSIIFLSEAMNSGKGGQKKMKLKMIDAPRSAEVIIYDVDDCWWIKIQWEQTGIQRKIGENMSVSAINKVIAEVFPENTNDGLCRL